MSNRTSHCINRHLFSLTIHLCLRHVYPLCIARPLLTSPRHLTECLLWLCMTNLSQMSRLLILITDSKIVSTLTVMASSATIILFLTRCLLCNSPSTRISAVPFSCCDFSSAASLLCAISRALDNVKSDSVNNRF